MSKKVKTLIFAIFKQAN